MVEEMIILVRTFDFINWLLPKVERFPRIYRHTVTRRLSDAALDFQERLLEAQSLRGQHRINALRQADGALNRVRIYLRLIHHWRWLNDSQYEHVSRMVMELGRMLGGWIKRTEPTRK